MALSQELTDRLRSLAQTPVLLVATDYDGTLAPIVSDPMAARPLRESSVALRSLAEIANTSVAVISGRALRDLAVLTRFPEEIHLVGSHGSEFDVGFVEDLTDSDTQNLAILSQRFEELSKRYDGILLETKPASVALHYRRCRADQHEAILAAASEAMSDLKDIHIKDGKMVLEVMVVQQNKGNALERLRHRLAAEAVIFLGDDTTDEEAFSRLAGPDLGIKVGPGESAAGFRADSPAEVSEILGLLSEAREQWAMGEGFPAIESLSFLSNGQTTALISSDARLCWLCHPLPDSSAVFAELLGGSAGGFFAVYPSDFSGNGRMPAQPSQRYVGDTLTVETAWDSLTVTDCLILPQSATAVLPQVALHRQLVGSGPVTIEFSPRPDFGRSFPVLELFDDGIVVWGGVEYMSLRAPDVTWSQHRSGRAVGQVELSPDRPVMLELRLGSDNLSPAKVSPEAARGTTEEHWRDWVQQLRLPVSLPDRWSQEVRRSALTLKGLCYQPTGAVLAAATTSLPEELGGIRNWDYRFCWPRDAAMTVSALVSLGSTREALDFLGWLSERFGEIPRSEMLRPLYPVEGSVSSSEAAITNLSGYRGSRPVRVGNAASNQIQHDMFGSVLDLMWQLAQAGDSTRAAMLEDSMWELTKALTQAVDHIWAFPDHGIWEARRPPRHHVHSKVMCWVAVDRAIGLAELRGQVLGREPEELAGWRRLSGAIRSEVLKDGWDADLGSYTVAYDDRHLDASILMMGLMGMLAADDPRYVDTVDAVDRRLRQGPIVYRYRFDDGLPGFEGGFYICAFWLVEALFQTRRQTEAQELFERLLDTLGPTGLLAEQYDPTTRQHLGNYPQAYSHVGLIRAALRLAGAEPSAGAKPSAGAEPSAAAAAPGAESGEADET